MRPGCTPICIGSRAISAMPAIGTAQAGQPAAAGPLQAEWEQMVSTLLGSGSA